MITKLISRCVSLYSLQSPEIGTAPGYLRIKPQANQDGCEPIKPYHKRLQNSELCQKNAVMTLSAME